MVSLFLILRNSDVFFPKRRKDIVGAQNRALGEH
jgi:hypothetical protein